jgi:hypothetical protein
VRLRSVASLVLVALIAGAIAAHADSGAPRRAPAAARPTVVRAVPPVAYAPSKFAFGGACVVPAPRRPVPQPAQKPGAAAPPSQALLDAFSILRRERTDEDTLSPEALAALRTRGLLPVAPESARLLRTTPAGGRAWVVPVPDLAGNLAVACRPAGKSGPREGLVVVAVGDAASGGGGALDDLVRGRSPVTVAPCAGADHSMLSISGIVPDGVPAVFVTAPDGTAVRADVKDNAYEFLLPTQRSFEQRYVVWTGGDGTPHVQPIMTFGASRPSACAAMAKVSVARVSPDALFPCMVPRVLEAPAPRTSRLPRPARARPYVLRCWQAAVPPAIVLPGRPVPAPPAVAVVPGRPPSVVVPARPVPAPAAPPRTPKRR